MNLNLQLLCLQAIPKLYKKFRLQKEYIDPRELYGKSPNHFIKACKLAQKLFYELSSKYGLTLLDIYHNSDIGMERLKVVEEIKVEENNIVLDIGCGRGYSTIAFALRTWEVYAIDLMNGIERKGWWRNFKEIISLLGLENRVYGIRANSIKLPIRNFFKVIAFIHSIRNFGSEKLILQALKETRKFMSSEGRVVVVENLPIAKNKSQEAHLKMYYCKTRYVSSEHYYFSLLKLLNLVEKAGFKNINLKILDLNLSSSPPYFYPRVSYLKNNKEIQEKYEEAIEMIKKYGEVSPPTLILVANNI